MYNRIEQQFSILSKFNRARASILKLKHGDLLSPVFMPVGTKGNY